MHEKLEMMGYALFQLCHQIGQIQKKLLDSCRRSAGTSHTLQY